MNRDDVDWAGYFPAVVTPFTENGDLDTATLHALIEQYAERGMHGVVVNGTCGEWFSQSVDERKARGREARELTPLSSHAGWRPAADRSTRRW